MQRVDCPEAYTFGALMTLTSAADATSAFGGWSGAGCTGTGTCLVTMNQTGAITYATGRIARCVRGAPLAGALTLAGGSVTDHRTKLVWQSATAGTDMTWQNALAYCEALVLDGNAEWRLPNGKELMSLVDPALASPTISPLFAARPATRFWSSSVLKSSPATAYAVSFDTGVSADIGTALTENRSVRCVR